MLIELSAQFVLVDNESLSGIRVWPDIDIDVISVRTLCAFDISVIRRQLTRPRLAVTVRSAPNGPALVLNRDRQSLKANVFLAVIARDLLRLTRIVINAESGRA